MDALGVCEERKAYVADIPARIKRKAEIKRAGQNIGVLYLAGYSGFAPLTMKIVRLKKADRQTLRDINALLGQLSAGHEGGVTMSTLQKILRDPHHEIWVAKDNGRIIGMGTLIVFPMLSGNSGEVEDVVVDELYRGNGVGTSLMHELIERASVRRCEDINLTSRPTRVAANALYQKLGFKKRDTNVYRLSL